MNKTKIKNTVAFKEVLTNNGYLVSEDENTINIVGNKNEYAYITEREDTKFKINLMDKEISIEDAIKIMNELDSSISLINHIDFVTNK